MKIVKNIAGIAFLLAFLMAIVIFGNVGTNYIDRSTARLIFMFSGAIGLLLNLISFQTGKHHPLFSFIYWAGSIVLFSGLIFIQFGLPYGNYILITGMLILGASFVVPTNDSDEKANDDLLDQ